MIHLELSLEEVNKILSSLGQQPYIQVAELIGKIRDQGNKQINQPAKPETTPNYGYDS